MGAMKLMEAFLETSYTAVTWRPAAAGGDTPRLFSFAQVGGDAGPVIKGDNRCSRVEGCYLSSEDELYRGGSLRG